MLLFEKIKIGISTGKPYVYIFIFISFMYDNLRLKIYNIILIFKIWCFIQSL